MKQIKDSLGNRMKGYEKCSSYQLSKKIPVIVRVDGKSFHSLKLSKPFDSDFMDIMTASAITLAKNMQGFKFGYVQSDEASFLLTDFDTINTEAWFDYDLAKVISISSAFMTQAFNLNERAKLFNISGVFDARAFNIPENDITNYFLWRIKDWNRNSLQMYCRTFFSHKQMNGKGKKEQHELLYSIEKNWVKDLNSKCKNGTFFYKDDSKISEGYFDTDITYEVINNFISEILIKKETNNDKTRIFI